MGKINLGSLKTRMLLGMAVSCLVLILILIYSLVKWNELEDRRALLLRKNIPAEEKILTISEALSNANLLLFTHISESGGNTAELLNEIYTTGIDSPMIELDTIVSRFGTVSLRNKFRRVRDGLVQLRAIHLQIAQTSGEGEDIRLPDLTMYPGYLGDTTLFLDEDFMLWYDQQKPSGKKVSEGEALFMGSMLPQYRKLETSLDELNSVFEEERELEESSLEDVVARFVLTVIICLVLFAVGGLYLLYNLVSNMMNSIRSVEHQLSVLSKGDIPGEADEVSHEFTPVKQGLKELSSNLLNVKKFAQEVGNGNFDNDIDVFNNEGDIGKSLSDVKLRLKNISEEDRKRNWSNQGFAQFADILRSNADDLDKLAEDVIIHLVKYLKANQGGIFILDEFDDADPKMILRGCYAFERKKRVEKEVRPGQGLVGQAWQEKESIYLTEVPQEYVNIRSGLGDSTPSCILIVPLKVNEEVFGVIELASFQKIESHEMEFVETLSESIASSIAAVKTNANTRRLLEESQQMTEEMRAQEEEMRQNMEELQATQEEMQRNSRDINQKEANLQALINNTDDSIITINRNYEVLVLNEQVRKRYKGTQYEGIDEGQNVLEMLGDVKDEWKAYYDRAFSGERLNFTIKSSVSGEDSYREYFINPIMDTPGEIVGASIFSRDVTERELELQQLREAQKGGGVASDEAKKLIARIRKEEEELKKKMKDASAGRKK